MCHVANVLAGTGRGRSGLGGSGREGSRSWIRVRTTLSSTSSSFMPLSEAQLKISKRMYRKSLDRTSIAHMIQSCGGAHWMTTLSGLDANDRHTVHTVKKMRDMLVKAKYGSV